VGQPIHHQAEVFWGGQDRHEPGRRPRGTACEGKNRISLLDYPMTDILHQTINDLRHRVRELEMLLYGSHEEQMRRTIVKIAPFSPQQSEVIAILYNTKHPLGLSQIDLLAPNYSVKRSPSAFKTVICHINKLVPGIIVSERSRHYGAYYHLSPEWRAWIQANEGGPINHVRI
jgi:hypothetical protein